MRPAWLDTAIIDRLPFTPAHAGQFAFDVAMLGLLGLPVVLAGRRLWRAARGRAA